MRLLPDGEFTADIDEYINAWQAIAKPIEEATGYKLYGFDPDFSFSNGKNSANIPYDFMKNLSEALKEYRDTIEKEFKLQTENCPICGLPGGH